MLLFNHGGHRKRYLFCLCTRNNWQKCLGHQITNGLVSLIATQPYFKEVEWSNWFHHLIILQQISKRYKAILTLLHNIIMPTLGPSLLPSQRMWIVMLCFSPCQRSLAIHELALGNICSTFLCSTFFCIQKLKKSTIIFLLYLIPSPHWTYFTMLVFV